MTTNTYALSRTERVWLLFSVTLLVSAAFYGGLANRVVSVMNRPELTTCLLDFPVLLLISLSIGFFSIVAGLYVCRQALARKPREEIA
ncbi:TPA: hypothetical protein N5O03_003958 [Enterobacter hormaechei subsp. xiangfangensis]|uniref:hypothetical protein n=1 Tax=Enterobacter hormaechei TaxID=158836 RepID=UPI0013E90196|nr:hypothetical protein [Enterobacter hormaechei]HCM9369804.1 hypothetical protein [Enterobacter hormaechei subsp. xiangfangensis]KAF6533533.1 hypothetical protein G9G00_16795 [Enterobacter hormaechei]KAF6533841.1 hypothetical protein G9G11_17200 [Enterobacter hormaechei]MCE1499697.1 hypothetical protein [Enterobacter hormaechei]HCM9387869.1 hypothetical protein [Enterobacter hormaechei subsp. xiangfangensis]